MDDENDLRPPEPAADTSAGEGAPAGTSADQSAPGAEEPHMEEPGADAPPGPRIEIGFVAGDFTITGGAARVQLHVPGGDDGQDWLSEYNGVIQLSDLPHRALLRVPDGAEVRIRRVDGDLSAERMDAMLEVTSIGGDADFDRVAVADVLALDGDLAAGRGGSLRVGAVAGDARVEDFDDACLFSSVGGDLHAVGVPRMALTGSVGGDAVLEHCHEVLLAGAVGGDLRVEHGEATVRAESIGGDATLASLGSAIAARIGGDLKAERLAGGIEVNFIGGDARIRVARGVVRLGTLGGDLSVQGTPSGVLAGRVGGDVTLDTPLGDGAEYTLRAAGDISLRVRGEVNARFVAQTAGGEVRTRLPLAVEKGRRRNLVGMLGTGSATVTLRSDGGDILITAADSTEGRYGMSDDFEQHGSEDQSQSTGGGTATGTAGPHTWEGTFGGRRFRVKWDRGPDRTAFHFQGPVAEGADDPDAVGGPYSRTFGFEWERGQGPRAYGEYEERLRELGDKAEKVARRAAEQAQRYAERAAQRARETDWEAVGREVRTAIEKAMRELEDAFTQVRGEWETRRPGASGSGSSGARPTAQRVRIEQDDAVEGDAGSDYGATQATPAADADLARDREAERRDILEQLRTGSISIEEAERRLNALK